MRTGQPTLPSNYIRAIFMAAGVMLLFVAQTYSQKVDTLPNVNVRAVNINDSHSSLPYQFLGKETLSRLNSLSVADAVKFLPGVMVKDYGGIGGLKTISVRSLGANSTGIMYDGIMISDAQNGQIDLGKLSLDNVDNIALYAAQPDDILLPARTFSASSIVVIKSTLPQSNTVKSSSGRISFKTGSFGFLSPAVFLRSYHGKHFHQQLSTEYQHASGKYFFKGYESGSGKKVRSNASVNALRLEYDAGYSLSDSNFITFKSYYYNSRRGLPGAIVLYNTQTHEKLLDENFFVQGSWRKSLSALSNLLFNVKYSFNKNKYSDPDFPNSQGGIENNFLQNEFYFSGVYAFKFSKVFSFSYGNDFYVTTLRRHDDFSQGFVMPVRSSWLNNLAFKAKFTRMEILGDLLYSRISDKVKSGNVGNDINALSPTLAFAVSPFVSVPLSFRAFYKQTFRVPTFNDLYYTFIGNPSLRPEYAKQYNAGLTYTKSSKHLIQTIVITSDFYVNDITDKIIAVPRQNLFQWTMLNIGTVKIIGVDAAVQLYSKKFEKSFITTRLSYTYQEALDKSSGSPSYNNQLPYTPKHSGSMTWQFSGERLTATYNAIFSGYRYRIGDQTNENLVKEWATQDINVSYNFTGGKIVRYKLTFEANNIFDKQYEIIRYYPMPGLNFRAGLNMQF